MRPTVLDASILTSLPSILKALGDNPTGAVSLVCLAAFALIAYALHKLK